MQMDHPDVNTEQTTERGARKTHSSRKRKECPTEVEQIHNRSRHTGCTQTTPAVQASVEADSTGTNDNPLSRPFRESGWIQHQGQPRDRILMTHDKGSNGYPNDVLDAGTVAASTGKLTTCLKTPKLRIKLRI